jgi:hypothetical protein
LRAANRDTPGTCAKGLLGIAVNNFVSTDALGRVCTHEAKMVEESETANDVAANANVMDHNDKERSAKLRKWLRTRSNQEKEDVAPSSVTQHEGPVQYWLEKLTPSNGDSFAEMLVKDDDFSETAKACMLEETEPFFEALYTNVSPDVIEAIHRLCVAANEELVRAFVLGPRNGVGKAVLTYLLSDEFTEQMDAMPVPELRNRTCLGMVVLVLYRMFLSKMRTELTIAAKSKWGDTEDTTIGSPGWVRQTKLLVNRFVGYGIFRLIDTTKEKLSRKRHFDDDDMLAGQLAFYRQLRIFHDEALLMPKYTEDCYDDILALENHGFLALMAPTYFDFGYDVMAQIRTTMTMPKCLLAGANALQQFKDEIFGHLPTFLEKFRKSHPKGTVAVSDETATFAVRFIMERACNAYYGCILQGMKDSLTKRGGDFYVPNCLRLHLRSISAKATNKGKRGRAKVAAKPKTDKMAAVSTAAEDKRSAPKKRQRTIAEHGQGVAVNAKKRQTGATRKGKGKSAVTSAHERGTASSTGGLALATVAKEQGTASTTNRLQSATSTTGAFNSVEVMGQPSLQNSTGEAGGTLSTKRQRRPTKKAMKLLKKIKK